MEKAVLLAASTTHRKRSYARENGLFLLPILTICSLLVRNPARATGLIQAFIPTYEILPNRLSGAGYAEFHTVSSNGTAEKRAKNRRLDVVILTPFQSAFQPRDSKKEPSAPTFRLAVVSGPLKLSPVIEGFSRLADEIAEATCIGSAPL